MGTIALGTQARVLGLGVQEHAGDRTKLALGVAASKQAAAMPRPELARPGALAPPGRRRKPPKGPAPELKAKGGRAPRGREGAGAATIGLEKANPRRLPPPAPARERRRLRFPIDEWREGRQVASALARGSGTSPSPEAPRGPAAAQRGWGGGGETEGARTKPEGNISNHSTVYGKEGAPFLNIAR